MGPLWGYPVEWWYYGGWAFDETGTKKFTILLQTVRTGSPLATMLFGIGYEDTQNTKFITNVVEGTGEFPNATSSTWSTNFSNMTKTATMTCMQTSGKLGLSGASYKLDMKDQGKNISASFTVKDNFGMIMEGGSGAFHKTGAESSLEFVLIGQHIHQWDYDKP